MIKLGITQRPPSGSIEHRQQSYSDLVVSAIQAQARSIVDSTATAATEAAAGALSRAFAAAEVSGPPWAKRAISPGFLAQAGRELVRGGAAMSVIDVSPDGEVELLPCSSWDIGGAGASPSTWMVSASLSTPNRVITRVVPFAGVVFVTWGSLRGRPWSGRSALEFASVTARLQSETERSLADEVGGPIAQVIPYPDPPKGNDEDEGDDPQRELKQDIANARGSLLLLETTAHAHGEGRSAAPRKDWIAESELGPESAGCPR